MRRIAEAGYGARLLAPFLAERADNALARIADMEQFGFDWGTAGAGFVGR